MREKNWLTKIIVILVGSIISAYGITLAMYAGFGSATLAVLWQGVSKDEYRNDFFCDSSGHDRICMVL